MTRKEITATRREWIGWRGTEAPFGLAKLLFSKILPGAKADRKLQNGEKKRKEKEVAPAAAARREDIKASRIIVALSRKPPEAAVPMRFPWVAPPQTVQGENRSRSERAHAPISAARGSDLDTGVNRAS